MFSLECWPFYFVHSDVQLCDLDTQLIMEMKLQLSFLVNSQYCFNLVISSSYGPDH